MSKAARGSIAIAANSIQRAQNPNNIRKIYANPIQDPGTAIQSAAMAIHECEETIPDSGLALQLQTPGAFGPPASMPAGHVELQATHLTSRKICGNPIQAEGIALQFCGQSIPSLESLPAKQRLSHAWSGARLLGWKPGR